MLSEQGKYEVPGGFPEAFLKALKELKGVGPAFIYVCDRDYSEMQLRGIDMSKIRRMSFFWDYRESLYKTASQMAKSALMVKRLKRIK